MLTEKMGRRVSGRYRSAVLLTLGGRRLWSSLTCLPPLQLRVSKEQEHFLVLPGGLAYSEVTGSSLVSKSNPSRVTQIQWTPAQSDERRRSSSAINRITNEGNPRFLTSAEG